MTDKLTEAYADLLTGHYDCPDRIVLNAYYPLGSSSGGFRTWWRAWHGTDDQLTKEQLMRYPSRFTRRLKAYTTAHEIPYLYCRPSERKHDIAESYIPTDPEFCGLFLVIVSRASGAVWDVKPTAKGGIHLKRNYRFVNHIFFHIIDPEWGHITIRMSSHPPFGAMIILNGHERVARLAREQGVEFQQASNCFTDIINETELAQIAESSYADHTKGQLRQLCDRWLYTTCLHFALPEEERLQSRFVYQYSLCQLEYSRNLLFHNGNQMEQLFDSLIDRSRSHLTLDRVKTIFGRKRRPHRKKKQKGERVAEERIFEKPAYDLTIFKLRFGAIVLKLYTKGEHVLRAEAVVHNTKALKCKRSLDYFPHALAELRGYLSRFLDQLLFLHRPFMADDTVDQIPQPTMVGAARVAGIDINQQRIRTLIEAVIALSPTPNGFSVSQLAQKVRALLGWSPDDYSPRQASYDLKKLRGKLWVEKVGQSRRYQPTDIGLSTMATLLTLRAHVTRPLLAACSCGVPCFSQPQGDSHSFDIQYEKVHSEMSRLFQMLGISIEAKH